VKLFWMSWFVNNFVDDDEITVFLKLMVVESLEL
jgi:hypothetical protein